MAVNVRPVQVSASTLQERERFVDQLEQLTANNKKWYEFPTPQEYRNARRDGTNGFQKPAINEKAWLINVAGRAGNSIELRVIEPVKEPSRGVWLHFHAGKTNAPWHKISPNTCLCSSNLTEDPIK